MPYRTLPAELHPHRDLIRGLVLLEDPSQLLLSASNDGTVAVVDIRSQRRTNSPTFVPNMESNAGVQAGGEAKGGHKA